MAPRRLRLRPPRPAPSAKLAPARSARGRYLRRPFVLNGYMKRILFGVAAALCVLGLAASTASAKIVEIGASEVSAPPSCPDPNRCFVVTRTTALQVNTAGRTYPTTVTADGRIVAFTLQLGELTERQIRFFNRTYGGTPRVQITVLSQSSRQKAKRFFTATAQSEIVRITPWLGRTVQFPLETSLPVRKGDFIALTVPTWAPVLAVDLGRDSSWRASRTGRCGDPSMLTQQTAQMVIGNEAQYKCLYQTAKLTYTATMITTPQVPRVPRETRRTTTRRTTTTR